MDALIRAIACTPIIDNHAHPLLTPEAEGKYPLLSITTEAHGDAMKATKTSLSHIRAVKQLSEVLGCRENWDDVVAAIEVEKAQRNGAWSKRCLQGIETILIDDGLDGKSDVFDYVWHNRLTRSGCKRIVRIEQVAQDIMLDLPRVQIWPKFPIFHNLFISSIQRSIIDADVAGFKSVICYRTGLNIPPTVDQDIVAREFEERLNRLVRCAPEEMKGLARIDGTTLNAFLVHETAKLIRDSVSKHKKPIQFHTGLGDNDITLTTSSPAHLQGFIKVYPTVPIVLLHASYPWTKEAGYLASVYENVYADIGEVFPMVSKEGQENVIREILELCPTEKILWSTDGHWFPETYLLAVIQVREALETVLPQYVQNGALTIAQAISAVQDMLFKTSNTLYDLKIPFIELRYIGKASTGLSETALQTHKPSFCSRLPPKFAGKSRSPTGLSTPASPSPSQRISLDSLSSTEESSDLATFTRYLSSHPATKYLRLQYLDYTATLRLRVVPAARVLDLLQTKGKLSASIANAALSILQNDTCPEEVGGSATGEYQLLADFSSLRPGPSEGYASVQCEFKEQNFKDSDLCPRTLCRRAIERARIFQLQFLLGFEIEIVFLQLDDSKSRYIVPPGFGGFGFWGSSQGLNHPLALNVLDEIVDTLAAAGIPLEYFHSESADGQFEFILPPLPPLEAVDTLIQARQIIVTVAQRHDLRATLIPKPFPMQAGTAAHVHISLVEPEDGKAERVQVQRYESFYAGVLRHLSSILAFSYPQAASYDRMADTCWAGGTWACWGTQNREAALRKIDGSHWEIKVIDGLANPYFAIAAIISAGTIGVADDEVLMLQDCQHDPSMLEEEERMKLGITKKLPKNLGESLQALEKDGEMRGAIGAGFVERYLAVKRAEMKLLGAMSAEERREWIIARY